MIVNFGGIICAKPIDPLPGSYNADNVWISGAAPRQDSTTVTSACGYNQNGVLKLPASSPRQMSPPLAFQSPVAVVSLRRQAEAFYAAQRARGHTFGPHIFFRQQR
jgi:hypothetical protein